MEKLTIIEIILVFIITGIVLACFILLLASVSRRLYNAHKYRILDGFREYYLPLLRKIVLSGNCSDEDILKLKAKPGSAQWIAIEDDLFVLHNEGVADSFVLKLFGDLGYLEFYRKMLDRRGVIARATAIYKLGMIKDRHSAGRLLRILKGENPEIIAVSVNAFCEISEVRLFPRFLTILSGLLDKKLVATKTIDSSLAMIGPEVIPVLLNYGRKCKDPRIVSSILRVLGDIPADNMVYHFALSYVGHTDPEVRAKALKVIGNCENMDVCGHEAWLKLLKDPVWFVRLQAVRALGKQRCKDYVEDICTLVFDEKWHVRNAAAEALAHLGEDAIDIFWKIIKSNDTYAKSTVCEMMYKTGFIKKLISILQSGTSGHAAHIGEILSVMASLGFTLQLRDYLSESKNGQLAGSFEKMISSGGTLA